MSTQTTVKIEGMTCQGCVRSVKTALEQAPGIQSVEVSLERKQADIVFDESLCSLNKIHHIIEEKGFDVQ
ncbi:hypothetical protein IX83_07400 [Basilea psittacipulmonis DSM 24701]|uniref:HMA domain-containing protein n=2 Tax=Basilea TaxID=1472344 RepID=A0A077DE76_9BURK|nr:hypothetical protein IX83_07400 [Basilea psittacipulmonis DSM 24701]